MTRDPLREVLSLLQRRAIIQRAMKTTSPGQRIHADRELLRIRERLTRLPPEAVQAITQAAAELGRPVEALTVPDVLKRQRRYAVPVAVSATARLSASSSARPARQFC